MKKNILILFSLLVIASMNAMNKRSGQDDDNDKDTLPNMVELSEELATTTQELTKLQIKVSVLEQMVRNVPAMKDVDFRKGISMTPSPEARALYRGIIKKQMAQAQSSELNEEDYLNAAMHIADLAHEAMVLSMLETELESHLDIIAKSPKQQAAPAAEASQSSTH